MDCFTIEEKKEMILYYAKNGARGTARLFYNYRNYRDLFTNEEKIEIIMNLAKGGSVEYSYFKEYIELLTNEQKTELLKSYGEKGYGLFIEYIDSFTVEQRVELMKEYIKNPSLLKDGLFIEYRQYPSPLKNGLFIEYMQYFSDEEIADFIRNQKYGEEFFKKNIEIFTNEQKLKIIKYRASLYNDAFSLLEVCEDSLSIEEKVELIKFFKRRELLEKYEDSVTLEQISDIIIYFGSYGNNGKDIFKKYHQALIEYQLIPFHLYAHNIEDQVPEKQKHIPLLFLRVFLRFLHQFGKYLRIVLLFGAG